MNLLKYLFGIALCVILLVSCNNDDLTPVYLDIDAETFTDCINVSSFNERHETYYDSKELQTIASSNFRDVECWINGTYLGIFELPFKIPMLPNHQDSNELRLIPCIRLNGNSSTVKTYAFLNYYIKNFSIPLGESLTMDDLEPIEFTYINPMQFCHIDNFENGTHFEPSDTTNDNTISITSLEGNNIGHIALGKNDEFSISTSNVIAVPGVGNESLWEIDYVCNAELRTGVKVLLSDGNFRYMPLATLRDTKGEWRKVYVNLSNIVNTYTVDGTKTYIKLVFESASNPNKEVTDFYFDNIKVISYK